MKYILSQEEFDKLTTKVKLVEDVFNLKLQKLCTLAARHVPVERPWGGEDAKPKPWHCILEKERPNMGYCDDCPSQEICPYDRKRYSK